MQPDSPWTSTRSKLVIFFALIMHPSVHSITPGAVSGLGLQMALLQNEVVKKATEVNRLENAVQRDEQALQKKRDELAKLKQDYQSLLNSQQSVNDRAAVDTNHGSSSGGAPSGGSEPPPGGSGSGSPAGSPSDTPGDALSGSPPEPSARQEAPRDAPPTADTERSSPDGGSGQSPDGDLARTETDPDVQRKLAERRAAEIEAFKKASQSSEIAESKTLAAQIDENIPDAGMRDLEAAIRERHPSLDPQRVSERAQELVNREMEEAYFAGQANDKGADYNITPEWMEKYDRVLATYDAGPNASPAQIAETGGYIGDMLGNHNKGRLNYINERNNYFQAKAERLGNQNLSLSPRDTQKMLATRVAANRIINEVNTSHGGLFLMAEAGRRVYNPPNLKSVFSTNRVSTVPPR